MSEERRAQNAELKYENRIICGNNKDILKNYEDNSFDSIVTDPPYELGFMGKKWDATGIAYNVDLWIECLRVLKPGGYLLAFGGTRTYHRMVCAIEDAGFEIRDQIQWIYASGFPKSLDISKAIDSRLGAERKVIGRYQPPDGKERNINKHKKHYEVGIADHQYGYKTGGYSCNLTLPSTSEAQQFDGWGTALKPANEPIVVARKPLEEKTVAENVLRFSTGGININGCRIPGPEPHHNYGRASGENSFVGKSELSFETPSTGRFPANVILECICENVEYSGESSEPYKYKEKEYEVEGFINKIKPNAPSNYNDKNSKIIHTNPDCPCRILDEQSGFLKSGFLKSGIMKAGQIRTQDGGYGGSFPTTATLKDTYGDNGGASRFFYVAKASRSERNTGLEKFEEKLFGQSSPALTKLKNGESEYLQEAHIGLNKIKSVKNYHPTVKPIQLMKYLVRLITPLNGKVLDPFAGSGTTGIACALEGFQFVGIEKEEEYCKIAEARIEHWQNEIKKEKQILSEATIQRDLFETPRTERNAINL